MSPEDKIDYYNELYFEVVAHTIYRCELLLLKCVERMKACMNL